MRYTNIAGLNFYSIRVEKIAKKKKNGESVLILIHGHQTGWQLAANNLR